MHIVIKLHAQQLDLIENNCLLKRYTISTGSNGIGEENNSGKTPRGLHCIRAKIGAHQAVNTVFKGRRPTGEIYSPHLSLQYPDRDWILSRILWLSGLESQKNRSGNVDTMRRYIYIHGTPDSVTLGIPGSKGCVRMRNADIIELFDLVPVGITVHMLEI